MRCSNPYTQGSHAFGCGQCMACRFNRRRVWAHRIQLEAAQHEDNAFVTLTYEDAYLPSGGSLEPKHLQDWLKRIRFSVAPIRLRYFAVGEYGDINFRPHYHVGLFGFPSCSFGVTRSERRSGGCCVSCNVVQKSWGMGNVMLGTLEQFSAQYIAGYVTKKMSMADDPRLIKSDGTVLHPEFARMSLRPGIGAAALDEVASELMRLGLDQTEADVPSALRHGKTILPLGPHLRRKLREKIGREKNTPKMEQIKKGEEMLPLLQNQKKSAEFTTFKTEVLKTFKGKRDQLQSRSKIFKQRRKM